MKSISVVIVTYNQKESLKNCVNSLLGQTLLPKEIIIVNNGSHSLNGYFQESLSLLSFIDNNKNLFYSQAQNLGIRKSRGDFILCLNDDVVLEKNFLREILRGFEKDGKIGMVSGKVLSFHERSIIDSTGLFLGKNRKPVDRGYKCFDRGQFDREGFIFGVPGAVGLYSRRMLEDIALGGDFFDSGYKMFYEDLDLCWRSQNKGWKAYYVPSAIAYHKRGATAKENNPRINFLRDYQIAWLNSDLQLMLIKNRYSTLIKNDRLIDFLKDLPSILAYELKLWGYIFLFRPSLIYKLIKGS